MHYQRPMKKPPPQSTLALPLQAGGGEEKHDSTLFLPMHPLEVEAILDVHFASLA